MREREREREREKAEGIETREGWAKACFTAPSLPSSILSPFRRRFIHSFIHALVLFWKEMEMHLPSCRRTSFGGTTRKEGVSHPS